MATLDPAILNAMLKTRIRESARKKDRHDPHLAEKLRRALGLQPFPPRTPTHFQSVESVSLDGYRRETFVFQSRPGFAVPGLLYVPEEPSRGLIILAADATWEEGKGSPVAQAFAVSFALFGFTVAILEAPGRWYERIETERADQGDAWSGTLRLGGPALGAYVWDLIRAVDALTETVKTDTVILAGSGIGAEAALLAFSLDERAKALVCANAAGSHELTERIPESLCQLGGIAELGDVADWLSSRKAAPCLFLTTERDPLHTVEAVMKTADKVKTRFGKDVRFAHFLGQPDFNRRMREVVAAFLMEHFAGNKPVDYVAELRPITDGLAHPYPAETVPAAELRVLGEAAPVRYEEVTTLETIAARQLAEPYPEVTAELIPWGSYGHIPPIAPTESLKLVDQAPDAASLTLPGKELDQDALSALGLNSAEYLGQVLHLWLPGVPEGMESVAEKGDPFSSIVASVRTLVGKKPEEVPLRRVSAEGPLASMTAQTLKRLRPDIEIETSHAFSNWQELDAATGGAARQPGARYRAWN